MRELEEPKAQKKEIEKRIKALENQMHDCGCARIGSEHLPTGLPDRHFLAIKHYPVYGERKDRGMWVKVFSENDKNRVINQIPTIIADLQKLYEMCTKERMS